MVKKIASFFGVLTAFVALSLQPVMAAGSPYSPYGPFNPQDTGIVLDNLLWIGVVVYALGLILVGYSKVLKARLPA